MILISRDSGKVMLRKKTEKQNRKKSVKYNHTTEHNVPELNLTKSRERQYWGGGFIFIYLKSRSPSKCILEVSKGNNAMSTHWNTAQQ